MRKIIYTLLATVSGLVLLFSYRTSTEVIVPAAAADTLSGTSSTTTTDSGATDSSATDSGTTDSGSTDSSTTDSGTTDSSTTDSGTADSGTTDSSATDSGTSASGLVDGTYTGAAASTRYGPVQVEITVSGGVITDVQVPEYPSNSRKDQQINERALPQLIADTLDAQSADVDMVSGATYTSNGYISSLQSAIDEATS